MITTNMNPTHEINAKPSSHILSLDMDGCILNKDFFNMAKPLTKKLFRTHSDTEHPPLNKILSSFTWKAFFKSLQKWKDLPSSLPISQLIKDFKEVLEQLKLDEDTQINAEAFFCVLAIVANKPLLDEKKDTASGVMLGSNRQSPFIDQANSVKYMYRPSYLPFALPSSYTILNYIAHYMKIPVKPILLHDAISDFAPGMTFRLASDLHPNRLTLFIEAIKKNKNLDDFTPQFENLKRAGILKLLGNDSLQLTLKKIANDRTQKIELINALQKIKTDYAKETGDSASGYEGQSYDQSKLMLFYGQLHNLALGRNNKEEIITFEFIDDKESILSDLLNFIMAHKDIFPKNVTIILRQYPIALTSKSYREMIKIQETEGREPDKRYMQHIKKFFQELNRDAGQNANDGPYAEINAINFIQKCQRTNQPSPLSLLQESTRSTKTRSSKMKIIIGIFILIAAVVLAAAVAAGTYGAGAALSTALLYGGFAAGVALIIPGSYAVVLNGIMSFLGSRSRRKAKSANPVAYEDAASVTSNLAPALPPSSSTLPLDTEQKNKDDRKIDPKDPQKTDSEVMDTTIITEVTTTPSTFYSTTTTT